MPTRVRELTQLLGLPKPVFPSEDGAAEDPLIVLPNNLPIGSTSITTTGNITQLNPQGSAIVLMNNASLATIQGIKAGFPGQKLSVISIGAGEVDFAHQNASANAQDRLINFVTTSGSITPLAAGIGVAEYQYDEVIGRWRLINHCQGAYIQVPFNSSNFTATTGTWTVSSTNQKTFEYYIKGRSVTIIIFITQTSVSNSTQILKIALPNAFNANKNVRSIAANSDSGTPVTGMMQMSAGDTAISCFENPDGSVNWQVSASLTNVCGQIEFETI